MRKWRLCEVTLAGATVKTEHPYFFKSSPLSTLSFTGMIEMRPEGGLDDPRAFPHSIKGTSELAFDQY